MMVEVAAASSPTCVAGAPGGSVALDYGSCVPEECTCHPSGFRNHTQLLHSLVGADPGVPSSYAPSPSLSWSEHPLPVPSNGWRALAFSPELHLFVAVADSGTGERVLTSLDGVTWTSHTPLLPTHQWRAIEWAHELGLFVALSASGASNQAMTSPDGVSWTVRATPHDAGWSSLVWSPEEQLLVAVASNGAPQQVMTSPDGIVWTSRTTPTPAAHWVGACYSRSSM